MLTAGGCVAVPKIGTRISQQPAATHDLMTMDIMPERRRERTSTTNRRTWLSSSGLLAFVQDRACVRLSPALSTGNPEMRPGQSPLVFGTATST